MNNETVNDQPPLSIGCETTAPSGQESCGPNAESVHGARTNHPIDSYASRRNSSLGVSLMTDYDAINSKSSSSQHQVQCPSSIGMQDVPAPRYRPLVGAGAAAAFEALRYDFYVEKKKKAQQQRRLSSLSFGSSKPDVSAGQGLGRSVNTEEQYELLKLHYLNLMNEIQETALMLNLYEQQQLVQKQNAQRKELHDLQLRSKGEKRDGVVAKAVIVSFDNSSPKVCDQDFAKNKAKRTLAPSPGSAFETMKYKVESADQSNYSSKRQKSKQQ